MIWKALAAVAHCFAKVCECIYPWGTDVLAKVVGVLCFDVLRIRRRVVLQNLRIAFPHWPRDRAVKIGRESVVSFFRTCFEFLGSEKSFKKAKIESVGESILSDALAKGTGVYILCAHLGNWELMCSYGAQIWTQTHVVTKDVGQGALAQWVTAKRRKNHMSVIDRSSDLAATKQIFTALKNKQMVGFIADQRRKKGIVATFFGTPCHTNDSLPHLWMRRKAPIVPVCMTRLGTGRYRFEVFEEVAFEDQLAAQENIQKNTQLINDVVETMVRKAPEQYFWMHRRWKDFEDAKVTRVQIS